MKRIALSLGMIVFAAALIVGATGAFFSDTETSTGNTFTAGAIDLKIDSETYYNGELQPKLSWELKNLNPTSDKFFDFEDIKPGDWGTSTISIHVQNNEAWACAAVTNLASDDNGLTEPEGDVDNTPGVGEGELDEEMLWTIWRDDNGNGVQDGGEPTLATGNPAEGVLVLYDSTTGSPLSPATTTYLGVAWTLPASSGNITQTDSLTGDISFHVVQSRNNDEFECSDWVIEDEGGEEEGGWVETSQAEGDASLIEGGDVLELVTANDVNSRVRYTNYDVNMDLEDFVSFSYDSKQVSAFDAINGNASFRLIVDLEGDAVTIKDITFEPYYNIFTHNSLNAPSIVPGIWQTWSANVANGKFWASGVLSSSGGGAYATNFTIAELLAAHPNAKILGISVGMGTYNVDQVVHVKDVLVNGTPYNF